MTGIKDRTAIVGIGQTEWGKGLEDSELVLALRAIKTALDDAGIDPAEVDGLSSYTLETSDEVDIARNLGLGDITWFSQVGYGGGAGCGVVGHAATAVATGQASVAVAWRSRKRGARTSRPWSQVATRVGGAHQWSRPFGLLRPVDEIAMLARRYLHDWGGTREELAQVAVTVRDHANRNPAAMMYDKPLSVEQYLAARWISEPLCLFDNCLESDGAAAVVITTAERAHDLDVTPALVHAFAQSIPQQHQVMTNYFGDDPYADRPGRAPTCCGAAPTSARPRSTWPSSTTLSRPSCPSRWRATASASGARAWPSARTGGSRSMAVASR